jgi:hypothetical protein
MDASTIINAAGAAAGGPVGIALSLASQFAPGIVQYFTGSEKAAAVAGKVLDIAQVVTGAPTADAAAAMIAADPAKQLEFQQSVLAAETDLAKAQYADMASARHLQEVALQQDDLFSKRFIYMFAAAWSVFTMLYATLVTFYTPATAEGKGIAQTVLGFLLGTAVASIFSYFYGSTKGSAEKTRMLAAATK